MKLAPAGWCLVLTLVAGCGVRTGPDSFEQIPDEDLGRLTETTTTTSSTTTTTIPNSPESTTTTTTPIASTTEDVVIYFLSRDQLRGEKSQVNVPSSDSELIDDLQILLETGPTGPTAAALQTFVRPGLILEFSISRGVLTIDLDGAAFAEISSDDQRGAVAQIVLTFLGNLTGVGQASFTLDGEPLVVRTGNSRLTSEPVSLDDYENMLVAVGPPETTTTTITTTPTTELPAEAVPASSTPSATQPVAETPIDSTQPG